jgi:hypothetical protein
MINHYNRVLLIAFLALISIYFFADIESDAKRLLYVRSNIPDHREEEEVVKLKDRASYANDKE